MNNTPPLLKAQSPAALAEEYIVKSIWSHHFPPGSDLPAERELATLSARWLVKYSTR